MAVHNVCSVKTIIILLDGVGDRPSKALQGLTPLQAARIPFINGLAAAGMTGLMDPFSPGIPVGSDTGHLAILGYDPLKYYTGRGPFEALGAGIMLRAGDVAFRCNLATVSGDTVVDRRAGRISSEEAAELIASLTEVREVDGVEVILRHTVEHRCVLVLRGDVSDRVSDADPHKEGARLLWPQPTSDDAASRRTAEILKKLMTRYREMLERHPINARRRELGKPQANMILPRGAGKMPSLPSLAERYGVRAAVIAGGALYKGVCSSAGMEVVEAEGATGTLKTNLDSKFSKAFQALKNYDLVFLHIKGTDTAAHDKDPLKKATFLESIDAALARNYNPPSEELIICVTGDHTTSSITGEHRGDPVPVLINGYGVRRDASQRFNEVDAAVGAIGRIRGMDLMNILMDLANRTQKYGE
jgi:2,3-bisphosphoglycerate-independent phosphoglycerate mutase